MGNIMHEVKVLRKAVNMKQYVLAEKLGVEQSNYANMENGRLVPKNIDEIEKRAYKLLKPELELVIIELQNHLDYLKNLYSRL